jgi:S1-C subfamily serine protease
MIKIRNIAAAFLVGTALLLGACFAKADTARLNTIIDQTNFLVNDNCSGTLIDLEKKLILTAKHCVTDQYKTVEEEVVSDDGEVRKKKVRKLIDGSVTQQTFDGAVSVSETKYRTRVVALSPKTDLALIGIEASIPNTIAAKLSCKEPARGQPISIVGNPMGVLYSSLTTGVVSSVNRTYKSIGFEQTDEPLMQVSGGIVGGNSGGSIYNSDNELVGAPVLAHRMNEVLAFAVPLKTIREFIKPYTEVGKCD